MIFNEISQEWLVRVLRKFISSISTGNIPNLTSKYLFKISRVVPIFKSKDPILLNNYRPILLLKIFSKILEKLLCLHISIYLTHKKILCE